MTLSFFKYSKWLFIIIHYYLQQSEKISEEIRKMKCQRETETLQDHQTSEKDLAHSFLQRLMMLDYRARYIPVRQDSSKPVPVFDSVDLEDNDIDALFSASVDCDQSKQTPVHPMDVQIAVFHCSDSFLKQNMITKLSQCQYALPLLVPDVVTMDIECPLWTFRQIKKTWKNTQTTDNSNIVTMKSMLVCKAETPMVSFFHLGSLLVSYPS